MSQDADPLRSLRRRARQALARGELSLADLDLPDCPDAERLLEDLRIHQAELEIQNRELLESRARAEAERSRYQALYESVPLPALVIDRMGVIEEANPAALDFFGFRAAGSLRRHSVFRLFSDRGAGWFGAALEQTGEGGGPALRERVPVLRADGEEVPMDCLALRLGTGYHADRHTLLLFIDRSLEKERDRERALYQSLMDNSEAPIYAFDRADRCLMMNRAAGALFGIDEREAVGLLRSECMDEERTRQEAELDRRALYSDTPLVGEVTWPSARPSGSVLTVTRFPLRDTDGEAFAVAVIATDVTEHRQLQSRLDLATEIFSRGSEAIIITDSVNRVTFVNSAFEKISGYREHEILGKNPLALVSGRHDREFLQGIRRQLKRDGFWEGEIWPQRKDGETYAGWLRISRVPAGPEGDLHHILVVRDISQEKMAEEEIERLAFFDMLTGTPNRYLLKDRTAQAVRAASRRAGRFAMAFLDLDRFKEINDAFGHETGDRLLIHFARRLREHVRECDTICRLGGDEFVLLLEDIDRASANQRLARVLRAATRPFQIGDRTHQISASIGVAMYPEDGETYEELLKNADTAMYQAKADGRDACRFFHSDMAEAASSIARIEAAMRRALETDGFHMVYQPQIDLASGSVIGLEALLRWSPDGEEALSPSQFIPIAEQSGLIAELGNWVVDHVLRQVRDWSGQLAGDIPVSVNVAAEQFWRDGFLDGLAERIRRSGVAPEALVLELTERTAMKLPAQAAQIMQALNGQGIELSLDDFGTGYSSLAYLKRFPLQFLKIDRSFVADLVASPDDQAICRAVIQVAHTLGMQVVAEGVETREQEAFLLAAGCDAAQGFLYSPGIRPEALSEWLARRAPATA
ncbi:EAL and GGDEF domain-containing protein [Wenzhouxiangella limi]|uniref:EAL domain-containing protein n=1 Tax=Wenzhouxiangella limi TaxID=2707351 RepID=A0A845UZ12_9GAMM|nr:bifunctional diguanylate cyclase/phosphodiesterase [Wenzhouxiangella limi]NDY95734.1 EAL domain-containing protein [Wenzhouxiangella limi]